MGTLRVTQGMLVQRVLHNLSLQMKEILRLQDQLATGYKVNAPSEGALEVRRAVNIRTAISKTEQYQANISAASPQLTESAASIETVVSSLHRAKELTLQGANGTYAQPQLDQIAIEINQILEGVLDQANHDTNGRYVFGGTRTLALPFEATRNAAGEITAVTYVGNDEHIEIAISDGINVIVNETGTDVFLSNQDIFQMLIDVRDDLRAGDQNSLRDNRLPEFEVAQDQVLLSLARIGAIQNRLGRADADMEEFIVQLQEVLSDTLDADYADTVIHLNAQSNAFQAALNAAARVIQPSLLDFVR